MNDQEIFAMNDLSAAIRNTPDYSLRRVLYETEPRWSWGLFCLECNLSYDNVLPRFKDGEHGAFYVFVWSEPMKSVYATSNESVYHEIQFIGSDASAVRWALELAGNWIPEKEEAVKSPNNDLPF